jgi:hypothetical protein
MRPRRRDIEVFSLSFLDCICCAFGAIILLFVLSKFGEPLVIEQTRTDLDAAIIRLEEEKHDIRGESLVLERELEAKKIQLTDAKKELARLQGDLSAIEGEYAAARDNAEVQNIIEGRMARTLQDLTEEMKRLSARRPPSRTPRWAASRWTASTSSSSSTPPAACSAAPGAPSRRRSARR